LSARGASLPLARRLRRATAWLNGPLIVGALLIGVIVICAAAAPLIAPFDPYEPQVRFNEGRMVPMPYPPGWYGMVLGSDTVGRDILSRLIYGSRYTLLFCGIAAVLRIALGAALGMIAGWYQRAGRVIDVLVAGWSAIPSLIFALVPILIINARQNLMASTIVFLAALSLTGWAEGAVRSKIAVYGLRGVPFVEAAYAIGQRRGAVLWRHVLPNLRDLLVIEAAYAMASALLLVAELGFLNVFVGGAERETIGNLVQITPIHAEWGGMLARGLRERGSGIWLLLAPMGAFTIAILAFNLLAEGLRRRR
jgi:peptide/nickel transport system permease protein